MLRGYFDDSFGHDGADVFTVAGYLADRQVWGDFEAQWLAILREAGCRRFHMSEFENRQGEFRNWNNDKRITVFRQLADALDSGFIWGVGITTIREDFDRVVRPVLLPGRQDAYREPYLWSLQGCMTTIAGLVEPHLDRAEGVELVFDRRSKVAGKAINFYHAIVNDLGWSHIFKGITFGSSYDHVPLQAADILAYEAAKQILNMVIGKASRPERKSFARLVQRGLVDSVTAMRRVYAQAFGRCTPGCMVTVFPRESGLQRSQTSRDQSG
jgi:hypothetical protein